MADTTRWDGGCWKHSWALKVEPGEAERDSTQETEMQGVERVSSPPWASVLGEKATVTSESPSSQPHSLFNVSSDV